MGHGVSLRRRVSTSPCDVVAFFSFLQRNNRTAFSDYRSKACELSLEMGDQRIKKNRSRRVWRPSPASGQDLTRVALPDMRTCPGRPAVSEFSKRPVTISGRRFLDRGCVRSPLPGHRNNPINVAVQDAEKATIANRRVCETPLFRRPLCRSNPSVPAGFAAAPKTT